MTNEVNETAIHVTELDGFSDSPGPVSHSTPLLSSSGRANDAASSVERTQTDQVSPPRNNGKKESSILGLYETIPTVVQLPPPPPQVRDFSESIQPSYDPRIIKETRDSLLMARDNYIHFISADCLLYSPIGLSLSELGFIDSLQLREKKPKKDKLSFFRQAI